MMYRKSLFYFQLLLCALSFSACQKSVEDVASKPASENEFVHYIIPAGQQFATFNPLTSVEYSELKFVVRFDSTAIYTFSDTASQWDVNKLYGFSDNNAHHNQFSARFGWRWKDNELHLFSYIYNNGIRADNDIGKIDIGKEHFCSIKVAGSSYIFTLDGKATTWPRASTTPKAVGYRLYPYFGGTELAPHNINVWIKELR